MANDEPIISPILTVGTRFAGSHPGWWKAGFQGKNPFHPDPTKVVASPDIGMQVSPCLSDQLKPVLIAALQTVFPNGDIRAVCVSGTERIGIWLSQTNDKEYSAARDRGVKALNLLQLHETFAFMLNSTVILGNAYSAWYSTPKTVSSDFTADPNGPIHLTGFSVAFPDDTQVITTVTGYSDQSWPSVDFQFVTTDTLSASGGRLHAATDQELHTDDTALSWVAGIFGAAFPIAGILFAMELAGDNPAAPSVNVTRVGAQAIQQAPEELLIPAGLKIDFAYKRVSINGGGLFAGGAYEIKPRAPEVSITGPPKLASIEGVNQTGALYVAVPTDLRATANQPLKVSWSGATAFKPPNALSSEAIFDVPKAQIGTPVKRTISVKVTDADDLSATASEGVEIYLSHLSDPPSCMKKPWLPECSKEPGH